MQQQSQNRESLFLGLLFGGFVFVNKTICGLANGSRLYSAIGELGKPPCWLNGQAQAMPRSLVNLYHGCLWPHYQKSELCDSEQLFTLVAFSGATWNASKTDRN